jgi:hypothetical protein
VSDETRDTETFTLVGPDGTEEDVDLPAGLADVFTEHGEDETAVAADFLAQAFAQQSHAVAHHSTEETPADLSALNDHIEELFEERFGVSLAEALGHSH